MQPPEMLCFDLGEVTFVLLTTLPLLCKFYLSGHNSVKTAVAIVNAVHLGTTFLFFLAKKKKWNPEL